MIKKDSIERFATLRKELFSIMSKELHLHTNPKSYEGKFRVGFPNFFEEYDSNNYKRWYIELDLHMLYPFGKTHIWYGNSFEEALHKAENEIRNWIPASKEIS
ncbi:hypothetical protein [Anaeromicrobium sediminis]|uniref:Uncharacterized protein n=1 Tax=Anaeromicrobium sediminis TaxID=1478221 RepID=A0A267MJC7_9FIRM|nr:hypothetical protein [Anaeromicrobium sediminis]PAB59018.1 hypothetical protein CCE28_12610 [Anaeromicrobium sediminis]